MHTSKKEHIFAPLTKPCEWYESWYGALAQLVEQWTENPCVPGSIPGGTTKKTFRFVFEGSFCFDISFYYIFIVRVSDPPMVAHHLPPSASYRNDRMTHTYKLPTSDEQKSHLIDNLKL